MITSFSLLTICSLSIVLTTYNTFSSYRICMATDIPIKSFNSIYRSVFVVCFMSFSRHHKLYATLMMPSTHIQHKIEMQIRYLFSCVILRIYRGEKKLCFTVVSQSCEESARLWNTDEYSISKTYLELINLLYNMIFWYFSKGEFSGTRNKLNGFNTVVGSFYKQVLHPN